MKALVIYDLTGRIWNVIFGQTTAPQGLTCMFVDIPEGATLDRIDVTNPDDPQPVYTILPDTDIGTIQKKVAALEAKVKEQSETIDMMLIADLEG